MFYLIKLNRTYHLRFKLPRDISDIINKQEIKFSLKVSRKRLATKKVSVIKRGVRGLFERIRLKKLEVFRMLEKGELTKEDINKIVRAYVHQLIDDFGQGQALGKHLNSDTIDRELEAIDFGLVESKINFAERRHEGAMSFHIGLLLDKLGISLDKNSESYQILCYEALKARIMVLEADKRKLLGDFKWY